MEHGLYADRDFDVEGKPRWFDFIVDGTPGDPEAKVVTFEWPLPQQLRLKAYARIGVREDSY